LKEEFSKRQRVNRAYSLRAYARDLALPASTLSHVLKGRRPLPLKNVQTIISKIHLDARERTYFMDSLGNKHITLDQIILRPQDDRYLLDETYFQIISEWEHFAVLILFDCKLIKVTLRTISERLDITQNRAEVVVENLVKYGMLEKKPNGQLTPLHSSYRTTEDVTSHALRASHHETLKMSQQKLDEIETELRDFSSMMVAIDPLKLPEMKIIIREFRQKVSELLKTGKQSEVYQLAIQFYPITKLAPYSKNKHQANRSKK